MKAPNKVIIRLITLSLFILLLSGGIQHVSAQKYKGVGFKDEGFTNITEAGVNIPFEFYTIGWGLRTVFAGHIGHQATLGGGIGIDGYDTDVYFPAFLDFRYYFVMNNPTSPWIFVDAGYALNPNDIVKQSGPMFNLGVGFRTFPSHSVGFLFSAGYGGIIFFDPAQVIGVNGPLTNNILQSMTLRIGLSF